MLESDVYYILKMKDWIIDNFELFWWNNPNFHESFFKCFILDPKRIDGFFKESGEEELIKLNKENYEKYDCKEEIENKGIFQIPLAELPKFEGLKEPI